MGGGAVWSLAANVCGVWCVVCSVVLISVAVCVIRRYYQSSKSSGLSSNLQPSGAKADHLREEMEEAANRMEICRVSLQLRSHHISSGFWR